MYAAAITLVCLILSPLAATAEKLSPARTLSGTWCLAEEDLTISFIGKDSVKVKSTAEDGVSGTGTFTKQDTMFIAEIKGDEVAIRMGYRYAWNSDSTIEARTLFITVNGDSIDVPKKPVLMTRCETAKESKATKK